MQYVQHRIQISKYSMNYCCVRVTNKQENGENRFMGKLMKLFIILLIAVSVVSVLGVAPSYTGGSQNPDATVKMTCEDNTAEVSIQNNVNVDRFVVENTDTGQKRIIGNDSNSTTIPVGKNEEIVVTGYTSSSSKNLVVNEREGGEELDSIGLGSNTETVEGDYGNGEETVLRILVYERDYSEEIYIRFEDVSGLDNSICKHDTNGGRDLEGCISEGYVDNKLVDGETTYDLIIAEAGEHEFIATHHDADSDEIIGRGKFTVQE